MGKDLRGKECGKGIYQRKDGRYYARYQDENGTSHGDYFFRLTDARKYLANAEYAVRQKKEPAEPPPVVDVFVPEPELAEEKTVMTVNEWFTYWTENIVNDRAPNTVRNYHERYKKNIQPVMGTMAIDSVKPMHCKTVLNRMNSSYAASTIRQAYITMGTMFRSAVDNEVISKHPMNGISYNKPVKAVDDIRFFTLEEQKAFLETVKSTHNYYPFAFVLETGLRTGELIALTWDCVDLDRRIIMVKKTMEFRYENQYWRAGPPKSKSGYRHVPLSSKAVEILESLKAERPFRKESEALKTTRLEYTDLRSGNRMSFAMSDLVFINWRTGEPTKNSTYDTFLYRMCEKAGIEPCGMHALRHTFATRMIERGVQPKVLQIILGHSSIKMTMDRYVHVTDDSLFEAIRLFETA